LDLLGDRWTLLLVRELLVGPQRYSDLLQHLPGMWSNLLARRLRALEAAGLVTRRELPPPASRLVYELTDRGRELEPLIYEVSRFGLDLLDDPAHDVVPLHLLPLGLRGMLRVEALPDRPLVVALLLDEGDWTLRIAPPPATGHPLTRVRVTTEAAPDADVTVQGSAMALLAQRRGVTPPGLPPVTVEGARADVATVEALYSPAAA
jgi:DNA-binding HxlR family transcriptional regulator